MRKLTSLAAAAVLTLGLVAPASAAPPERGEEFIWSIFLDQDARSGRLLEHEHGRRFASGRPRTSKAIRRSTT